jgi:hypothetical protein
MLVLRGCFTRFKRVNRGTHKARTIDLVMISQMIRALVCTVQQTPQPLRIVEIREIRKM